MAHFSPLNRFDDEPQVRDMVASCSLNAFYLTREACLARGTENGQSGVTLKESKEIPGDYSPIPLEPDASV
jgi:hypothetical protein